MRLYKKPITMIGTEQVPYKYQLLYDNRTSGNTFCKGHHSSAGTILSQVTLPSEQARP